MIKQKQIAWGCKPIRLLGFHVKDVWNYENNLFGHNIYKEDFVH